MGEGTIDRLFISGGCGAKLVKIKVQCTIVKLCSKNSKYDLKMQMTSIDGEDPRIKKKNLKIKTTHN